MTRVLTVARVEFLSLVRTKAFLIGILMMPVLLGVAITFQVYAARHVDTEDRRVAVVDHSGALYDAIALAAARQNALAGEGGARRGPHFIVSRVDPGRDTPEALRLALSDRIREEELFAFVEIPAGIIDAPRAKAVARYYTGTPSYERLPDWLERVLNDEIARLRYARSGIDPALAARLNAPVALASFGLAERGGDGTVADARATDPIATFVMPFVFLFLMFMAVVTGAQHLLNAIVEEKMSKISEVLMGSIEPFTLLLGKLLGVTGVAILLATIYFAGGMYAIFYSGRWDLLQPRLIAWFYLFLVCAVLMYGSIFLALGSACSDLKDAQSMMQPALLLIMLPYLASFAVIRAPDSSLATGLSLFPTMTPFIMMMRLAMPPGPPIWQVALSMLLVLAATALFVWAAGRIFRIGILMQGKSPNLAEVLRWVRA
jgi:ABC-2 type transport system permease protein